MLKERPEHIFAGLRTATTILRALATRRRFWQSRDQDAAI